MSAEFIGWLRLTALHLRTFRYRVALWPLVIGVLVWATAAAVPGLYDTPAKRSAYAATAGASAAARAFNGRGYALDTVGGITAYELGFYALLVFPAIAVHLAIHLTRTQEAAGRLELLAAGRLGRRAPLLAAATVLSLVVGASAALSAAALARFGSGGLLYAAALAGLLVLFAGVGLVAAQVAADGHGAHALGLGSVGALFLARAVIDGADLQATWLTPYGWFGAIRPFDRPDPLPLLALLLAAALLFVSAGVLRERRDLGSGLISPAPGPASAGAVVRRPAGVIARLLRGTWIGWTVAAALWGFTIGLIADEMDELVESNPAMQEMLGAQGAAPEDLMISVGGFFLATLAIGFAAQSATRLAAEETSGRLASVLATRVSRPRWWLGQLVVVGVGLLGVLLISATALGAGVALTTGRAGAVVDGVLLGLDFAPAVAVCAALALLALSVHPRWAGVGWAVFGWVTLVQFLGETLGLPGWLVNLSPLHHVGQPPLEPVTASTLVSLGTVAVLIAAGSALRFRARDLSH